MKKGTFVALCVVVFILALAVGVVSKGIKPAWSSKYSVKMTDEIGTKIADISYGSGDANKFDLYLPKDNSRKNYGLVVYLHAGGFTTGDKSDDEAMLAWLTSKGYVAAGINYTLRTDDNNKSVYTQSVEIKEAMPKVIEAAKARGYNVNEMTISGGSAGGSLAMLYAYRDTKESPVPVKLVFEMVGSSSFHREDWKNYGLDKDTEESITAAAGLFSVMSGNKISVEDVKNNNYQDKVANISAYKYVDKDTVPSVLLYGKHDTFQPYEGSLRLKKALEDSGIDFKYYVAEHSGHGVQNDDAVMKEFMESVEEYLEKYMPVKE